jgi:MFS family permease
VVGPAAAWRIISSRNFGPYFAGNAIAASGTWFQNLAAAVLVYRLTHSPFLLGVLNFSQFAPVLLLASVAGNAADRFDRRAVLAMTQLASAGLSAALAVVAWEGAARTWVVITLIGLSGILNALGTPAQQALVTSLVEEADVPQAIALNSATFSLARALGPTTAAGAIALFGIPAAFALNAASYLVLVVALRVVHPRPHGRAARPSLRETLALVRHDRRLGVLLLIILAVAVASDPINTESPAFARIFGYSTLLAGVLVGAFGAGAVMAAVIFAGRVAGSRSRMASTLGVLAVGIVGLALSPWLTLALVPLFLAGFGFLASQTAASARLQLRVADEHRGRMMALWSVAFIGVRPLASLVDGALGSTIGVRPAAILLALPALVGAAVVLRVRSIPIPVRA